MSDLVKNNICLLFHCLCDDGVRINGPHQELFIPLGDLRALFDELMSRGFSFSLPWDMKEDQPNCVITFDDGYYNNNLFLRISKEYNIPFILFLNSYNISENKNYIWDIWEDNLRSNYPLGRESTRGLYEKYGHLNIGAHIDNDLYRPFKLDELRDLIGYKSAQLGLHGHYHQPLIDRYRNEWEEEISQNRRFFADNGLKYANDFSLPSGIYTFSALNWAKGHFDRIYTINGNYYGQEDRVIDRITLMSPRVTGRSLIAQVDHSLKSDPLSKIRKGINLVRRMKYAYLG